MAVRESVLTLGDQHLLVWSWYWIDGSHTVSDVRGKLLQVRERITHARDDGAAVIVYAPFDDQPERARSALSAFVADNGRQVEQALAANLVR
jgi:EpsI family protein